MSVNNRYYLIESHHVLSGMLCCVCILFIFSYANTPGNQQNDFNNIYSVLADPARNLQKADVDQLEVAFAAVRAPSLHTIAQKNFIKLRYYETTGNDFNTALRYADSNINLLQNARADTALARIYAETLNWKASIYAAVKNYDEAIRNFTLAQLNFPAAANDSCQHYEYYYVVASLLFQQKKYLQAAAFYRLKCEWAKGCKKDTYQIYQAMQENLDNIGICYSRAGMPDSALYYFQATLDYIDKNKQTIPATNPQEAEVDKGVVFSNIARVLATRNNYAVAENYYLQSIAGTKPLTLEFTNPLRLSLAELYLQNNELVKAGKLLTYIAATSDSSAISNTAADLYKYFSEYYIKSNQPYAANLSLQRAYAIRDSIEARDRRFNALDVRNDFESRERKNLHLALQKDSDVKNGYILLFSISIIAAVVIIFFICYSLYNKSVYARQLSLLNAEVTKKNDELEKTFISLDHSDKENNRVLRVVAHDLKNPVSAIRTLVYSLIKKEENEKDREAYRLVQSTCTDSLALINDLLNKKRSLSEIRTELVDLGKLIEQCSELFQLKADEKKQHIVLQLDDLVMVINRQKIWRVISNIVNNAIKVNPEHTEILIRLQRVENSVIFSVQDKGQGMKDTLFSAAPVILTPGVAGEELYGTGFTASRKIIEEHNGKIWVETETGKGTVFYVELPYSNN